VTRVGYVEDVLCRYRIHGSNVVGTRSVDRKSVGNNLNSLVHTLEAVNERLGELGIPVQLDAEKNVYIRLESYKLSLLRGDSLGHVHNAYVRLARAIIADDLLRVRHKIAFLLVNGIGMLTPVSLRPWLLTRVSGPSKLKYWMQKLVSAIKRSDRKVFERNWNGERAVNRIAPEA